VTRVLVATASATTGSWFAAFPSRADGLWIVGITAPDALAVRVHELEPDLVLIDVTGTELDEITSSIETIGAAGMDVILLADREHLPASPSALVRAGVRGVLSVQPTREELESALRAVGEGLVVMDPAVLEGLPRRAGATPVTETLGSPTQPLTPREVDVLNALAEGLGNKQIAARLEISEHTVKTHLAAIFEKLETSNRTEAVMAGARLGLLLL
jgi:two-component system, NarL family, response regulator YdfI